MDVFQSLVRMESFPLLRVFYHCIGILLWPANSSNHPIGSSCSVAETFLYLG